MKNELKITEQLTKKSKLQQRYESLLQDIETSKRLQENLENELRNVIPRIRKEIRPLFEKRTDAIRLRILRLDELADEIGVGKTNIESFASYIAREAIGILNEKGFEDNILVSLYQRYTGELPLPPKPEIEEIQQQEVEADEEFEAEEVIHITKPEKMLLKDAKAVYVRLVKRFHPDLEQDETLKIRKTALVQEITKAYKEKDFLKLLSLQIEHIDEKEDEEQILADDMLKRYNKILSKQLNKIKQEIEFIKQSSHGLLENFFDRNNKFSEKQFRAVKKQLKREIEFIMQDTRNSYYNDRVWFKDWLREIKDFS